MFGEESSFLLGPISLIVLLLLSLFLFNTIMRKILRVKKKKFLSYNHVNEKHKKIDWTIRISTIVVILIGYVITLIRGFKDLIWYVQPWFILLVFLVVSEMVRAVMERKYAENSNDYKLTISQLILILILFFTLVYNDFFGLI